MLNPYAVIGALLLCIGIWFGGEHHGHSAGVAEQAQTDQKQFDQYNKAIAAQKAQAVQMYQKDQADIIALQTARASLTAQLEEDHVKQTAVINASRTQLASMQLRFAAAQASGSRAGSGLPQAPGANPPGDAAAQTCTVSAETGSALKALAYDADALQNDYNLLYAWAHSADQPAAPPAPTH